MVKMTEEEAKLIQEAKKQDFRQLIAGLYIFMFIPGWFGFMFFVVAELGVDVAEALMLGAASGVFLASFKDMWQFLWRKS